MDAQALADLLISRYLSPAADTWDTSDPAKRWDPIKMAVGIAAGWAITMGEEYSPSPVAYADELIVPLVTWAALEAPTPNVRDLILNGGTTGKGGFRGRLAAELVNLGY